MYIYILYIYIYVPLYMIKLRLLPFTSSRALYRSPEGVQINSWTGWVTVADSKSNPKISYIMDNQELFAKFYVSKDCSYIKST